MTITPSNHIVLVAKAPVDPSNRNFLKFATKQAQDTYMLSKKYKVYDRCTYTNKAYDGTPANQVSVTGSADSAINAGVNLIMYKNDNFTEDPFWYYGFVNNIQQVNKTTMIIDFSPAWMLNYFYTMKFGKSPIERGMVSQAEDIPGKFVEPEGLETGEFVINQYRYLFNGACGDPALNLMCPVARVSLGENSELGIYDGADALKWVIPAALPTFAGGCIICGQYQGAAYVAGDTLVNEDGTPNKQELDKFNAMLTELTKQGKIEKVQSIFLAPKAVVTGTGCMTIETWENNKNSIMYSTDIATDPLQPGGTPRHGPIVFSLYEAGNAYKINDIDTVDKYTPRNKKLLTQDYMFLTVTNGEVNQEFGFEYFWRENNIATLDVAQYRNPTFEWYGGINEKGAMTGLFPIGYKTNGQEVNVNYGLTINNYPDASYCFNSQANTYNAQISQRKFGETLNYGNALINMGTGAIKSMANMIIPGSGGTDLIDSMIMDRGYNTYGEAINTMSGAKGLGGAIENTMSNFMKTKDVIRSPQATSGQANGNLRSMANAFYLRYRHGDQYVLPPLDFVYFKSSITQEYAKKIDDYFDVFGYKLNVFDSVDKYMSSRPKFNYIKTGFCNIKEWGGPDIARLTVAQAFEQGITIWHDAANWLNYDIAATNR